MSYVQCQHEAQLQTLLVSLAERERELQVAVELLAAVHGPPDAQWGAWLTRDFYAFCAVQLLTVILASSISVVLMHLF